MSSALLQAGGCSTRMRESGQRLHKALVKVQALTLLERNVLALLAGGFGNIFISVNTKEQELIECIRGTINPLVRSMGAQLELLLEDERLGTIGAASQCAHLNESLLIVNVDNLLGFSVKEMVAHHESAGASMTIATHWEEFLMPFGEVKLDRGIVDNLIEKPVKRFHTSSGTYVLSANVCKLIENGQSMAAPTLYEEVKKQGLLVCAFEHDTPWIDINDASSIARAEELVFSHFKTFERPFIEPHVHKIALVTVCRSNPLEMSAESVVTDQGFLRLPEFVVDASCSRRAALQALAPESAEQPRQLIEFDSVDVTNGCVTRYHLYYLLGSDNVLKAQQPLAKTTTRALAALRHLRSIN